eukprot:1146231-Pleurochrysis_carterae.AAC.1
MRQRIERCILEHASQLDRGVCLAVQVMGNEDDFDYGSKKKGKKARVSTGVLRSRFLSVRARVCCVCSQDKKKKGQQDDDDDDEAVAPPAP